MWNIFAEEKLSQENDRLRSRFDGDRFDNLKKIQQQLMTIEKDRDYWRDEAMQMQKMVQNNMRVRGSPGQNSVSSVKNHSKIEHSALLVRVKPE